MKRKIFQAKYETAEFLAADSCLVGGGFLIGTNLVDTAGVAGAALVALGLFLGIRVLWKFSSDLKGMKAQIDAAMKDLEQTNGEVKANAQLLNDAEKDLLDTQRTALSAKHEVQELLLKLKKTEEKVFGFHGANTTKRSKSNSLDDVVDKLKKDVEKARSEIYEIKWNLRRR